MFKKMFKRNIQETPEFRAKIGQSFSPETDKFSLVSFDKKILSDTIA